MKGLKSAVSCLLLFVCSLTAKAQTEIGVDSLKLNQNLIIVPKNKFKISSFIIPTALIGYGVIAVNNNGKLHQLDLNIRDDINNNHPNFRAHIDSYLLFVPAAAVYGLNLSGIKGKHNLLDATMLYAGSTALSGASSFVVKKSIDRLRPDESGNQSFPSGHTALIFSAAEFLKQEYADVSPLYGYGGYLIATVTGSLRMYNNKHWFSDVVAGAGIGIASTKITYLLYPYFKEIFLKMKANNFSLVPYYQGKTSGFMLCGRF